MNPTSLRLSLLDAQVLDAGDRPIGRVDDLDLEPDDQGLRITALRVGQRHLGPRVGGLTGSLLGWVGDRLDHDPGSGRIDVADVASWSSMVKLRRRLAEVPVAGLEKWLSTHAVRHLPGARDEGV